MKKLHLIGFTPGNDGLILSPRKDAKSGGFVVALDDDLVFSIEAARRRRDGEETEEGSGETGSGTGARGARVLPRSSLSPREIQARLRAGNSIGDVAGQAGVEDEWVLRFAAPILAEQAQVIESAQRLTQVKARRGPSIQPLAPSVQWNLSDRGVRFSDDVFADLWTAYNLHGARWAVRFAYTSRKRRQVAEWEVDLRERSLVARNRLATDLGHVEAGRRRPSLEPPDPGASDAEVAAASEPGRAGRATRAPAAKTTRTGRAAAGSSKRASATRAATTKAAGARKAATKKAATTTAAAAKKAAAKTAGAKKAAARKAAIKKAAAKTAGAKRPATSTRATASRTAATRRAATGAPATRTAAKRAGRESAPRKARPTKKPAGDTPGGSSRSGLSVTPVPEAYSDRPSHLARPPSPMKMANRATSYPSQRLTGTYARQGSSEAPQPGSSSQPRPAPAGPAEPGNPRFDLSAEPARPAGARSAASPPEGEPARADVRGADATAQRTPDAPSGGRSAEVGSPIAAPASTPAGSATSPIAQPPVASPIGRRPMATRPVATGGGAEDRPAVVILSTPAPGRPADTGPENSEGQARLAAAERLRSALAGSGPAAAPPSGSSPQPKPGRRARRAAGN